MDLLKFLLLSMAFYWLFKTIDRSHDRRPRPHPGEHKEDDHEKSVSNQPIDMVEKLNPQWRLHHYIVAPNSCFICIQWYEDRSYTSYRLTWSEKNGPQYIPINDAARPMAPSVIANVLKMIDQAASASNRSR